MKLGTRLISGRGGAMLSLLVLLAFVCGSAADLYGQASQSSGQIDGLVSDPQGAVVTGVEVSARNIDTNYTRFTTTDDQGRYSIGPLPIGSYEVTVKPANMEASTKQVYVSLGSRTAADFNLGMAAVRESIEVRGELPVGIEPTQTFNKAVLTELQLRNIPAAGRRVKNLFTQIPGTQIEPECGMFSMSGQKGVYASFNVDGGDYTSSHFCGHVEMSPSFTIEALQEFQILRSTFSAEFGRSTGGIINLATKSGGNEFHGSVFELFRHRELTHRDPLNPPRDTIGVGNQFGGSIGGPLKQDKTFFFSAAEFQNNTRPVKVLYQELDNLGVRNTAGAQALLAVAPEDSLTARSQFQSFVNRFDHRLTDNNTLTGRLDFTRGKITDSFGSFINTSGLGSDSVTNRDVENASPTQNRNTLAGMVQFTSVLTPQHINEFRVQLHNEYRPWDPGDGPEVSVLHSGRTVAIYGPQATGLSYGNVGFKFQDIRRQFIDNFSIVTGSHTMKFGVDANLVNTTVRFNPGYNGIYRFDSLTDYLARNPSQYSQFAGSGEVNDNKNQIALYWQDEWRALPGFTISPGFRYEMAFMPDYRPATVPSRRAPQATKLPDDLEMYGPRLGLAWDIGQNAKTVLRAAAGLFYAPPYVTLWEQAIVSNGGNPELSSNVVISSAANIRNAFQAVGVSLNENTPLDNLPVFSSAQIANLTPQASSVFYFDEDFRLPRALQYRVALEQELASGISATLDYTQISTTRMDRVRDVNLPKPTTALAGDPAGAGRPVYTPTGTTVSTLNSLRPNTNFGAIYITESSARSLYRAISTNLAVRRNNYTFDLSYILGFSKSHDDHENGGFSSAFYTDANDLDNEYNWSNIDQRHQFMANGVVFLPMGFEASTQMRFNTGRPISARTGSDSNRDGISNDRAMSSGYPVIRNTFRNLGFAEVDARVQKSFTLPNEKGTLSFSTEFFNLFNSPNVESNQTTYGPDIANKTNALFGLNRNAAGNYAGTLRTTPFQVQLGVRLQF
jgi:hypothetical protein